MKKLTLILMISFLVVGISASFAHSSLISTFNSDDEGWTVTGATGPTYMATGGNPGGYIQGVDSSSSSRWSFISPDSWDGDWSSYIGGTLEFDLLKTGATGTSSVWNVIIYSWGKYAVWDFSLSPSLNEWNHFSVDLTSSNFDRVSYGATFESIMSDVTAVYILADYGGDDTGGLDNARINAVPVPPAAWLLGSGLFGLVGLRRKFWNYLNQ